MHQPDDSGSRYCDINFEDPQRCVEIDLLEGNTKAIQATLHTVAGEANDGRCNQWGCNSKWGPNDDNCFYGVGSPNIDVSSGNCSAFCMCASLLTIDAVESSLRPLP